MSKPASSKTSIKRNTAKYQASELVKSTASLKKTAPSANSKKSLSAPTATRKATAGSVNLDVNSTEYDVLWKEARTAMGKKPIHAEDKNRIDHILRIFDFNPDFGPCVGMSRLERWERAEEMDLNPPKEIKEILLTTQGQVEDRYSLTVLHEHDL